MMSDCLEQLSTHGRECSTKHINRQLDRLKTRKVGKHHDHTDTTSTTVTTVMVTNTCTMASMNSVYFTCSSCRIILLSLFIVSCLAVPSRTLGIEPSHQRGNFAHVVITYKDIKSGKSMTETNDGTYGTTGSKREVHGRVIHVRNKNNRTGCSEFENEIPPVKWVALIKRGQCLFQDKIVKAAKHYNASAVVVYDNNDYRRGILTTISMDHSDDVVSVFITKDFGEHLGHLVDTGNYVTIAITHSPDGQRGGGVNTTISKTSVLFVSISFIVLMIISLAWLVFYYIQRFRYAHAKERLSRRLANAAKKAISRIPQKTVKAGDKELERDYDQCAVCIEVYKSADVIRILPCKHVFHKSCVDPWLMEQRSCPMCKMDILRAFGLQLNGSQESVVHVEAESVTVSGIEPEAPSSPEDPLTTNSASLGPKLVHFTHPSVQFHGAPHHDLHIITDTELQGEIEFTNETHDDTHDTSHDALIATLPPETPPPEEMTRLLTDEHGTLA